VYYISSPPRIYIRTNTAEIIYTRAGTSPALPRKELDYAVGDEAEAIPSEMLYAKGIIAMVRNAGMPSSMSFQLMLAAPAII
jgi:hypothetical protein